MTSPTPDHSPCLTKIQDVLGQLEWTRKENTRQREIIGELINCLENIGGILQEESELHWNREISQIIDVLAKSRALLGENRE